jgi:hypothetical protein
VCMQTRCPDLKDYNYESKLLYASRNIKNNEGTPISLKTKFLFLPRPATAETGRRRKAMTLRLNEEGIRRPTYASANSKAF